MTNKVNSMVALSECTSEELALVRRKATVILCARYQSFIHDVAAYLNEKYNVLARFSDVSKSQHQIVISVVEADENEKMKTMVRNRLKELVKKHDVPSISENDSNTSNKKGSEWYIRLDIPTLPDWKLLVEEGPLRTLSKPHQDEEKVEPIVLSEFLKSMTDSYDWWPEVYRQREPQQDGSDEPVYEVNI